ncbi:MAG: signal peptidase II [Proteobacteria bacterium]|nr:signal peptidase II [Pseudomonadota bacterium]
MGPRRTHVPLGLAVALLVLILDQASKAWVLYGLDLGRTGPLVLLPVLDFTLVGNRGVTFGMLTGLGGGAAAWSQIVLSVVSVAVVIGLGVWLRRAESRIVAAAVGAIAGGAVGNVIDRLRLGHVVDFIHAHIRLGGQDWSWYVFNVADAAIVCGVIALVLDGLRPRGHLASATHQD